MKDKLSINTEICSYFLWEYTKHVNALDLWYCAEDIGFFLEKRSITSMHKINSVASLPKSDPHYIEFIRHIAYRLYRFTGQCDMNANWFAAEKLIGNAEWLEAAIAIANIYVDINSGETGLADVIRSERIRKNLNI